MSVEFTDRQIDSQLENPGKLAQFIEKKLHSLSKELIELDFVFCTDAYLWQINKDYLNHDFYTDIITFDLGNSPAEIIGEALISVERVRENAKDFETSYQQELHRVIFHGVLHLLGYGDKTEKEAAEMRNQEDQWLLNYKEYEG